MALINILDPLFNPLLYSLGPFFTLLIISILVSAFTTLIYMWATDQPKLKRLKADMKRYQAKLKTLKDSPDKALKVQKDLMKLNGEFMKSTFKTTIYTILPLLLFFGWLGANLAFMPLLPDEPFSVQVTLQDGVSGTVTLSLPENITMSSNASIAITNASEPIIWDGVRGATGIYDFSLSHEPSNEEQFFPVLITPYFDYEQPVVPLDSDIFQEVSVGNKKWLVFENIFIFKDLPLIKRAGWLGAYILFSLLFSTLFRKLLKLA